MYVDYSSPAIKNYMWLGCRASARVLSDIGSCNVGDGLKVRNEARLFGVVAVEGQSVGMMWCLCGDCNGTSLRCILAGM